MIRIHKNVLRGLALSALFLGVGVGTCGAPTPVAWWRMDSAAGGVVMDSASGTKDRAAGDLKQNPNGADGKCLKFDGYTCYIERRAADAPRLTDAFSVEAWVALQEYPWNWTAVLDRQSDHKSGCFFGIDYQGAVGLNVAVDGKWYECNTATSVYNSLMHVNGWSEGAVHTMIHSDGKIRFSLAGSEPEDLESRGTVAPGSWKHVAIAYSKSAKACRFYIDGKLDVSRRLSTAATARLGNLQIGAWDGGERNFKGQLDDFRIYGRALSDSEVAALADGSGPADAVHWWKFDEQSGDSAADSVGGRNGVVHGGSWTAGRLGSAILLDGQDDYIEVPELGSFDELTISVWVNTKLEASMIPLHEWTHIAGTYDGKEGISIYLNGKLVEKRAVTGSVTDPSGVDMLIGLSHEKLFPVNTERGPSMVGSYMLFDGLMDEVKVYDKALSPDEVQQAYSSVVPPVRKPLKYWQMPTGPSGTSEFGASYCQLKYGDSWDEVFRSGEDADVVVRFDEHPINYVFWKGWNYGLCMVTENGLLSADQSVERGNENGCVEHMSDKQDRYSHISIVENNDARAVLHWRYAPCDIFYNTIDSDPKTGWGDWVDEYFYIYPDGVMMREQKLWSTGRYGGDPSVQETLFFSQPGKGPLDTVEVSALTLANDEGQTRSYAWQPDFPWGLRDKPEKLTIQMLNFKSRYKPYLIRRPGATVAPFSPSGYIDFNFPYWNHWPVSQLPNDGREGTRTDRPAHTSLTWFEEPATSQGILHTWIYMYGLTTSPASELGVLSRSWNSPAPLTVMSGNCKSRGYGQYQRAYELVCTKPGKPSKLEMTVKASPTSPMHNPAFVVRNWGDVAPTVKVNGAVAPRGKNCRVGINTELEGSDLVLWLQMDATSPVTITLIP